MNTISNPCSEITLNSKPLPNVVWTFDWERLLYFGFEETELLAEDLLEWE
jgi:hypothetical protein